jgi:antirestriction protein ArdC
MRADNDVPAYSQRPDWAQLLIDAVTKPGIISEGYRRFWNFSAGNQLLAMFQCLERGIPPGPIHTFKGWLDLGRHVRKGQKAITLCMPVTVRRKLKDEPAKMPLGHGIGTDQQTSGGGKVSITVFTYKPHWFVLSQTDGAEYVPRELPTWSEAEALKNLQIERVPFVHPNGNCQGYADGRSISVSPIAALPHKTLFHEFSHVIIGHTQEFGQMADHDLTPVNLREVEAESVALICCESLNLAGAAECRGYIQHWLGKDSISDRSAQRIFKAADQILKAGRSHVPDDPSQ